MPQHPLQLLSMMLRLVVLLLSVRPALLRRRGRLSASCARPALASLAAAALALSAGAAHAIDAPGPWGNTLITSAKSATGGALTLVQPARWTMGSFGGMQISPTVNGGSAVGMGRATILTNRTIVNVPARYTLNITNPSITRGVMSVMRGTVPGAVAGVLVMTLLNEAGVRWRSGWWETPGVSSDSHPDWCWSWVSGACGFVTILDGCIDLAQRGGTPYRSYQWSTTMNSDGSGTAYCYGRNSSTDPWTQIGGGMIRVKRTSPVDNRTWVPTGESTVTPIVERVVASNPAAITSELVQTAPNLQVEAQGRVTTDARTRTGMNAQGVASSVSIANTVNGIEATDLPQPAPDTNATPDPTSPTGTDPITPDPGDPNDPSDPDSPSEPSITCGLPKTPPCKIDETGTPDGKSERAKAENEVQKALDEITSKLPDLTKPAPDQPFVVPMPGFPTAACEPIEMGPWRIEWCWVVPIIHACFDAFWCIAAFFGCLGLIRSNFTSSV